jgi:hypothetical protein
MTLLRHFLLICAAGLFSLAASAAEMVTPSHPYWPLPPGRIIDYAVYDITGVFHPDTLHLDVTSRTLRTDKPYQSIVVLKIPSARPTIGVVQYVTSEPVPTLATVNMYGQLTEGLWKPTTGRAWIGEDVNQVPPLPKLMLDTTPGPVVSGTSDAVNYGADGSAYPQHVPWQYRTHHAGVRWGAWPDTVRTALFESGNVYNYVFARGEGMVDLWYSYGGIGPGNTVVGIQMFALRVR